MDAWHQEVVELHEFFEAYFLGDSPADDLARLDAALAADFTIVDPSGVESSRAETVDAIRRGHGHSAHLKISITDARLLADDGDTVVGRYVENHELAERSNHRVTTIVFSREAAAPNGLRWRSAHETWIATS